MAMASFAFLTSFVLLLLCLSFQSRHNGVLFVSASRETLLLDTSNPDAKTSSDSKEVVVAYREPDRHSSQYDEPLQYDDDRRREKERYDERSPQKEEERGRERESYGGEDEEEDRRARTKRYDERGHRKGAERPSHEEGEAKEEDDREHKKYDEDEDEGDEDRSGRKSHDKRRKESEGDREDQEPERFVIEKFMKKIQTEAGEMYVLPRDSRSELSRKRISLGFVTLEPKALLLPQYSDASCLFVVYKGSGRLSWTDGGDLQETDLEEGDVFKIDSGTVFHLFNKDEGQRLHVFGIHDVPSAKASHNFFVAGGLDPETVLSGFPEDVLATVFNVSADEVHDTLSSQTKGPILYFTGNESRSGDGESATATLFPRLFSNLYERNEQKEESSSVHTMKKFVSRYLSLSGIFSEDSENKPYNIWKKKPDFSNAYGSAAKADEKDLEMLKDINKGVFAVKLKAGAVMAPHWNPRAMEIALVTKGEGEVQIVYPNGTAAATERVQEGTVFYVPQNFPMCQIASRSGPLEFIGFSTSSKPNNPQFLAGLNSVLKKLKPEVLASSFNIPSKHVKRFIESQTEAVILPGHAVEPESEAEPEMKETRGERRSLF